MSLCHRVEEENRLAILDLIDINPSARIIDLGCGNGEFKKRIKEKASTDRIYCIEIDKQASKEAQIKGIAVINANLNQKIPVKDEEFDAVNAN